MMKKRDCIGIDISKDVFDVVGEKGGILFILIAINGLKSS